MWDPSLETFDFGTRHPVRVGRFQMVRDFVDESGFLNKPGVEVITPVPISESLLQKTHAPEYIEQVKEISRTGVGEIDIDTPGFKGIYENALITAGATVTGVKAIHEGRVQHFYTPTGGFHHAKYSHGGGFCIFNDIAASVILLKELGYKRILIADFDVHHGNGTQPYFYDDPGVMQISFHEDPEWLYPHDGLVEDIGEGDGVGYNVNVPLPIDSGDAVYRYAFDELVPPLLSFFRPDFILFLPGFDAHYRDILAQLNITTHVIRYVAETIHAAAHTWSQGRLGVLSGGGYHPDSFRWGIGQVMSVLTGYPYEAPIQEPPFDDDDDAWADIRYTVAAVKDYVFGALGISKTPASQIGSN
jgi:acetoin utilization protein AcuC